MPLATEVDLVLNAVRLLRSSTAAAPPSAVAAVCSGSVWSWAVVVRRWADCSPRAAVAALLCEPMRVMPASGVQVSAWLGPALFKPLTCQVPDVLQQLQHFRPRNAETIKSHQACGRLERCARVAPAGTVEQASVGCLLICRLGGMEGSCVQRDERGRVRVHRPCWLWPWPGRRASASAADCGPS